MGWSLLHQKATEIIVFLMVLVPTQFVGIRGLFVCVSVALFLMTRNVFRIDKNLGFVTIVMILCSAFALVRGALNGHFEISFLLFYVLGPIFVAYAATIFGTLRGMVAFQQAILSGCAVGSALTLLLWVLPALSILGLELANFFQFRSGTVMGIGKISTPFLGSIIFGIPFAAFKIICRRHDEPAALPITSLILMGALALVSGRTAVHVVLAGTFVLLLLHLAIVNFRLKTLLKVILCLFFGSLVLVIVAPEWLKTVLDIASTKIMMEENETLNSHRRAEMITSLLSLFTESPFGGQGIGFKEPGGLGASSFEIVWLQVLVSYGLFASIIMVVSTCIVWMRVATKSQAVRAPRQDLWPWFYAWVLYMLANLSNPLILKFDSLWICAIPAVLWMAIYKAPGMASNWNRRELRGMVIDG